MNIATKIPFRILLFASAASAEVVRFDVELREDLLGGKSWGLVGAYERRATSFFYWFSHRGLLLKPGPWTSVQVASSMASN